MNKAMTYEELMEYAGKNYSNGGDGVVECWDRQTFNDYILEFGEITKAKADEMFKLFKNTMDDMLGW